ncbi:MAG: hypothetical protein ACLSFW_07540 [Bacteroides cellulosilyticus]
MLQKLSFTFHHYQFIAKKTYPDYTRDALAPYLLHSQVPLTEESTGCLIPERSAFRVLSENRS